MVAQRLSKVLASAGVASRRACEELIFEGHVLVNGQKVLLPQTHVEMGVDELKVKGKLIEKTETKKYFILNKPKGYYCSNKHGRTQKLVVNLFKEEEERLFTVGRLDRDTTGLILVTNDGHYSNKVIHPSSNIQKEYVVKTSQEITDEHLQIIRKGCMVEETFVRPIRVSKVRKGTVKIIVKEGKKREVRRMAENAGLKVLELARVRIGGLLLGPLKLGEWRTLTKDEQERVFKA